jgi:diacylglycerol kinase (ATP)
MGYLQREIKRVWSRFFISLIGLKYAWTEESSFPQWVAVNVVSIIAAFAIDLSPVERALIIAFGLLILVVELLNTGIEAAIDRISLDIHPLSKKAKDVACAAVFMTALALVMIWVIILVG